jgi:hypothetical protein
MRWARFSSKNSEMAFTPRVRPASATFFDGSMPR